MRGKQSVGLCQSIMCCGVSLQRSNGSDGSAGGGASLSRQHRALHRGAGPAACWAAAGWSGAVSVRSCEAAVVSRVVIIAPGASCSNEPSLALAEVSGLEKTG